MKTTPERPDQHTPIEPTPSNNRIRNIGIAFAVLVVVLGLTFSLTHADKTPTFVLDPAQARLSRLLDQDPSLVAQFCQRHDYLLQHGRSDAEQLQMLESENGFTAFAGTGLSDSDVYYAIVNRCSG